MKAAGHKRKLVKEFVLPKSDLHFCYSKKKKKKWARMIGVGKMKQYSNVLDRPLSKGKQEVFSLFLFSSFTFFHILIDSLCIKLL